MIRHVKENKTFYLHQNVSTLANLIDKQFQDIPWLKLY